MWLPSLVYNCFILYALQASLVGVSTLVNYNERHVDKVIWEVGAYSVSKDLLKYKKLEVMHLRIKNKSELPARE